MNNVTIRSGTCDECGSVLFVSVEIGAGGDAIYVATCSNSVTCPAPTRRTGKTAEAALRGEKME